MKKKIGMLISAILAVCLSVGTLGGCSCSKSKVSNETTPFVIMAEEMDGVFNPFFYTAGPDGEIVGMTQIGMLSSNEDGEPAYGENEPSVILDYDTSYNANGGIMENGKLTGATTYTFVLKNGIKFSDGVPLSIRDVLFNLYIYLDPAYTGSSTIYSTAISGLSEYRTGSTNADADAALERSAQGEARSRLQALYGEVNRIVNALKNDGMQVTEDAVYAKLGERNADKKEEWQTYYKIVQTEFRNELNTDFRNNKTAYEKAPYNMNDIESFMYAEGVTTWDKKANKVKDWNYPHDQYNEIKGDEARQEAAVNYIYDSKMPSAFQEVVTAWGTATKLMERYTALAKEEIIKKRHENGVSGIRGIEALGNQKTHNATSVTLHSGADAKTYDVALLPTGHQADGTYTDWGDFNSDWSVKTADKYQVLQITINGIDPKAIWNFGFTVAPMHYYSDDAHIKAFSIEDDRYGVEYSSFTWLQDTVNGIDKVGLPVGAGPYKATDANNSANPDKSGFFSNKTVYFVRNENFLLGSPKIKYIRYQVVTQSNAINVVKAKQAHFVMPQATVKNMQEVQEAKQLGYVTNRQNGYGYIGINAGKVPNVHLRHAIMAACDTKLSQEFYGSYAETLDWPMSKACWASPEYKDQNNPNAPVIKRTKYLYGDPTLDPNDPSYEVKMRKAAQKNVLDYMRQAGITTELVSAGDAGKLDQYRITAEDSGGRTVELTYTFTIAGADFTEHPTYSTFRKAQEILNACGWTISVDPDPFALSKLASGDLTVWAAAWSSAIDPDMYQVYHRNSSATSTYAWGYREMKNGASSGRVKLPQETLTSDWKAVDDLSKIIATARKFADNKDRVQYYHDALSLVMDLGVELPTYQRDNAYVYHKDIVDASTLNSSTSPFTNPLSRIWEVSLNEN